MIKVKHLCDAAETDDGLRLWIEPIGLTRDLQVWCSVEQVLSHLGPPRELWMWYEDHPQAYDFFRAKYHEALSQGPYRTALQELAIAATRGTVTLLHQGEDPAHNTGVALHEYLTELEAYCRPE